MLWLPEDRVGAKLGDNPILECTTDGYPEPKVYWTAFNQTIKGIEIDYCLYPFDEINEWFRFIILF